MTDDIENGEIPFSPTSETHDAVFVPAPPTTQNELANTFPHNIPKKIPIIIGQDRHAYGLFRGPGENPHAVRITGKFFKNTLRQHARLEGITLTRSMMSEVMDYLQAYAETSAKEMNVWLRTAPSVDGNGVTIDIGNDSHTHIQITPGNVDIKTEGSGTLFYRSPLTQAFPIPAEQGDLNLLDKYINLRPDGLVLLITWICYTLAHPKVSTTNFVILVVQGNQGSGKTFLCKIIQALIDPSVVGVQTFPRNEKDLVISAQDAHVLFYDNMRGINPSMSDKLCIASTGGHLTTRRLYTDAEQQVHRLHVALVLNGIQNFIEQSDLAQRSLPLPLHSIIEKDRRSESELEREFQADLPKIFRGLLDHTADMMTHLPTVEVIHPERMVDFSRWLAAKEKVDGVTTGIYQALYSKALNGAMLDSLLENPLAAAVMSFTAEQHQSQWSGTPTDLYQQLNVIVGNKSRYSQDWPQNPIALSKRLQSLQAGLKRQGIEVQLGRGKDRKITIIRMEDY